MPKWFLDPDNASLIHHYKTGPAIRCAALGTARRVVALLNAAESGGALDEVVNAIKQCQLNEAKRILRDVQLGSRTSVSE